MTPVIDWDDAFANMAHVEGSAALPETWAERAAAYRQALPADRLETDLAYGDGPRQRLDLVWPDGPVRGLAVFVHGGYWMRLTRSHWTDLAEGARARGWAVCIPGYTLAPEARIHEITAEIGRAIGAAAARVEGPVHLAGHSAGGHLVTRMLCDDTPLAGEVLGRVRRAVSISGLHDLRPLLRTRMNETLRLDAAEAASESAALHGPAGAAPLTCWVGGGERPEFIRQSELMASMWYGLDVPTRCHVDGTHDHFTVIEGLGDAHAPIVEAFVGTDEGEDR